MNRWAVTFFVQKPYYSPHGSTEGKTGVTVDGDITIDQLLFAAGDAGIGPVKSIMVEKTGRNEP